MGNTPKPLDKQLFGQFMTKIPVWNYANPSKENDLSLSFDDKDKIIRQYYYDIKAQSGGEFKSICCLLE